ncbi:MAG: GMC family oxidoreductase [Myxococcota bacterium]|nr:GMC family oxidoreductase [Myxococcota bacterium]
MSSDDAPAAAASRLALPDVLRADAVVIGTGAGGGPAAAVLAEAGLEVLVLEAGPRLGARDFDGDAGLLARLMTAQVARSSGLELYAGRCVGGSTVVNDALCWRPPPEVLEAWRREHGLGGLTEAALAPWVERAWRDVHASPTGRAHLNRNARHLEAGARRLGWSGEAMPRNVRGCANLGLCNLGCPSDAKQSTLLSYVPRAERAGARVLAPVRAERLEVRGGAVRAVEARWLDADGREPVAALRLEAPLVCLAAGVLGTPALLLRSGLDADGATGTGIQLHASVYVTARFDEPVHGFYGPTMAYAVTEFSDVHGHRGPGFMLENVTVAPTTTAGSLPGFGDDHAAAMESLPHLARAVVVLRDRTRGRIGLAGEGLRIDYDPVAEDLARLRQAVAALAQLYLEAGAREVFLPVNGARPVRRSADLAAIDGLDFSPHALSLIYGVHLFGGAAMGARPGASTCDETGRVHGLRGLYVTDAAALPSNTGANPQITIMANALRVASGAAS